MKRIWTCVLAVSVVLCFMIACKHEPFQATPATVDTNDTTGNSDTTTNEPVDTSICFERDILPIFLSNCAMGGCHDAASHQEGYILNSYNNIMNTGDDDGITPFDANGSEIYESITEDDEDKRMPQGMPPLPQAQIALIKRWINEGAQNGTNCVVLCDTNNITYNAGVKVILQQNCVGCHNSSLANGGVNLTTFNGVTSVVQDGSLLGAIRHQAGFSFMPQGAAKLSACKIRQVEKWIQAGAQEN